MYLNEDGETNEHQHSPFQQIRMTDLSDIKLTEKHTTAKKPQATESNTMFDPSSNGVNMAGWSRKLNDQIEQRNAAGLSFQRILLDDSIMVTQETGQTPHGCNVPDIDLRLTTRTDLKEASQLN